VTSTAAESATRPRPTVPHQRQAIRRLVPFLQEMDGGPLVLDAGIGTRLRSHGLDLRGEDPCLWNLHRPGDVLELHSQDLKAGSRVLITNTFGANRACLSRFAPRGNVKAINRAGVELARLAANPSVYVVGDVGSSATEEPGAAGEQAAALIDAGVDALILETFRLEPAVAVLTDLHSMMGTSPVPLIVSFWLWPHSFEDAARRPVESGAAAVGLNCRPALSDFLPVVRRPAAAVSCPLLVKPGAASGGSESGSTPAAFAAAVLALVEHSVRLIGGCCGPTEAHVAIAAACATRRNPEPREIRGTAP
jgi:homocysteine S-methyltransferase